LSDFDFSNYQTWSRHVAADPTKGFFMPKLEGKVALVTGASKGIGAGVAKALAAEGAAVVVNYASSKAAAEAVVEAISKAGGRAVAVQGDMAKAGTAEAVVAEALKAFGRLDVLVNNAGVYEMRPLAAVDEEHYRRIFDINVLGLILATKAAAPHLGEGSSVINISSIVSTMNPPTSTVYSASKAAVDAITGVLSKELGPRGVRVNAIRPGVIETPGTHEIGFVGGTDFEKYVVSQTPLGRIGQPDDVGAIAVFLASDDSRWLSGEKLLASGGMR
jgi:3-oxoacyl-[acyl-carrier protein] reductase